MLLADSVRDLKCINKRIYSFKQVPLPSDLIIDCKNIVSTRTKYKLLEVASPARARLDSGLSLSGLGVLRASVCRPRILARCDLYKLSNAL